MHCKHCEYPLWNIPARICPECGTPFVPSEFEFVPNAVRFCCVNCDQEYFGTGEKGHLVPDAFACVTCGKPVQMDEMVLRPAEGVQDHDTQAAHNPWLERKKRGRFKSWMKAIGHSLVKPGKLIRATKENSSSMQALWFAMLTIMTPVVLFLVPTMGLMSFVIGSAGTGAGGTNRVNIVGLSLLMMLLWFLGLMLFTIVFIGVWSLLTHGLLKISGEQEGGLGRTFQAICYSAGASVFNILALCGGQYISYIWWCVSATIMVKEGHKIHGGRAAFAVLTPPIVLILSCIGLYVGVIAFAFLQPGTSFASASEPEPGVMNTQLLAYAAGNNGQGPDHAAALIDGTNIFAIDFVSADSSTYTEDILVSDVVLDELDSMTVQEIQSKVQAAADAMGDHVIAHRVGDFVFTYHGMDLNNAHSGLWVLIYSYDPDSLVPGDFQPEFAMGLVGGSTITATPEEFPAMLETQNTLRADHGLPPLPDPVEVTHTKPATEEVESGD